MMSLPLPFGYARGDDGAIIYRLLLYNGPSPIFLVSYLRIPVTYRVHRKLTYSSPCNLIPSHIQVRIADHGYLDSLAGLL